MLHLFLGDLPGHTAELAKAQGKARQGKAKDNKNLDEFIPSCQFRQISIQKPPIELALF